MSTVGANEISKGNVLLINNEMYEVIDLDRVKPGKGGAFVQATLKHILNEKKLEQRFRTEDKVTKVDIFDIKCTFFWDDEDTMTFIRKDNNEQICINKSKFPKYAKELKSHDDISKLENVFLMMLEDESVINIKY